MKSGSAKPPLHRLFSGCGGPGAHQVRIAEGALLVLLLSGLAFLALADKPWNDKILERIAQDKPLKLPQIVTAGLYLAAVFNVLLLAALRFTARWWAAPVVPAANPRAGSWRPASNAALSAWWGVALLAVLCAGALRWNLAHRSLWWDETWNLTRATLGERVRDAKDPSRLVFEEAGWDRAFFYYYKPTNHVLFTVTSKVCLGVWQKATGREAWEFDEFVFRFPNFLAALAAVLAIALLLRDWGHPVGGLVAAWLLAIHPWHIRYGIDARAFSGVVLLAILSALALTRALRGGLWRHWLGFGLLQWLLLWSFPYAIHLTLALSAAALAGIWFDRELPRRPLFFRFVVGGLLGAMLFVQCMGPNMLQIFSWENIDGHGVIGADFLSELGAAMVSGMPWNDPIWASGTDGIPSLLTRATGRPGAGVFLLFVLPASALAGLLILFRRGPRIGLIAAAWLLAAGLAVATAWGRSQYFYPRYVIYGLPAFLALAGVAVGGIPRLVRPGVWRGWLAGIAGPAFVILFAAAVAPGIHILVTRPYSPNEEVAQFLAGRAQGDPDRILACGFGLGGKEPAIYNPWMVYADDRDELLAMMDRSRAEAKPLFVFLGYDSFNRANQPSAFPLLDDATLFETVGEFHGIESQFIYRILRYK